MSRRPPQVVSTVDLPSGKVLEVVQPEAGSRTRASGRPRRRATAISASARACASELVEPIEWASAGPERWRVALRCPNCEHWTEGVFSQECVDRFDERLDDGTTVLVQDLKRLEHANMAKTSSVSSPR